MASVTTKEVFVSQFKLSKSSLQKIIKAGCNSDRIVLCTCFLDFNSEMDISGPEYKTTYLSFRFTGGYSNWSYDASRLKKILKAISLCSLKTSLQTLDVYGWGFEVSEVEGMLKEFNLEHVKVVRETDWSLGE